MADIYVSNLWGNDSSNGLTPTNAKATISSGISVAVDADNNIFIFPGIYNESVSLSLTERTYQLIAQGKVILDGKNTLTNGIVGVINNSYGTKGLEVRNYLGIGISHQLAEETRPVFPDEKNIIHNCSIGINYSESSGNSFGLAINNTIYDCCSGIALDLSSTLSSGILLPNSSQSIKSNTIFNCAAAIAVETDDVEMYTIIDNIFINNEYVYMTESNFTDITDMAKSFKFLKNNVYHLNDGPVLFEDNFNGLASGAAPDVIKWDGLNTRTEIGDKSIQGTDLTKFWILYSSHKKFAPGNKKYKFRLRQHPSRGDMFTGGLNPAPLVKINLVLNPFDPGTNDDKYGIAFIWGSSNSADTFLLQNFPGVNNNLNTLVPPISPANFTYPGIPSGTIITHVDVEVEVKQNDVFVRYGPNSLPFLIGFSGSWDSAIQAMTGKYTLGTEAATDVGFLGETDDSGAPVVDNVEVLVQKQHIASPDNGSAMIDDLDCWNAYLSGVQSDNGLERNSLIDTEIAHIGAKIPSLLPDTISETASQYGGYVGAHFTEIGWYNSNILSEDAIISGVEVLESGIILESGASSGTIELAPLNIGSDITIEQLFDIFIGEEIASGILVDSDLSDNTSVSGLITIEVRRAENLSLLALEPYSLYNLREDNLPTEIASGQYFQTRLTLNG